MSYYQHKIYCDLDYKTLFSIAADHFESLRYYQSDGNLFKNKKKIYQDSDSLSFSVAVARSLFETSEDVFVISDNLKGKFSRKEINFNSLPIRVRQRFKNMPNILKIDLNTRLYRYQYQLVIDITKKLKNSGFAIYDDCFNGQLLGLYDNYDDETRLEAIHTVVKEYFSENNLPDLNLSTFLPEFSLLVGNLEKDSILALKTAEYLREIDFELPDYSPIVIEYCKIIEIEIYHKILLPLKNKLNTGTAIQTANSLKKLKNFITSTENKSIELGTFSSMLESIVDNNLTDNLATSLVESILQLPFKRDAKYLIQDIYHVTRNYRNKAAHKSILTKEDMENCRSYIIGNYTQIGLLSKIVSIG
jgi:hypothetical protein